MVYGRSLPFTHVVIHHTGAEERDTEQIRRYHLSKGWRDIGYHFVVERNGQVVAGRKLSMKGAHCLADGMNSKAVGIALIGNFEVTFPSYQQVVSLLGILKSLHEELGILTENIFYHRQVRGAKTLCPGRNLPEREYLLKELSRKILLDYRTSV